MKKFVIGLLALCLVIIAVFGLSETSMGKTPAVQNIVSEDAAEAGVTGVADGETEIQVTEEAAAKPETAGTETETAAEAESNTAAEEAQPAQAEAPSTVPDEPETAS